MYFITSFLWSQGFAFLYIGEFRLLQPLGYSQENSQIILSVSQDLLWKWEYFYRLESVNHAESKNGLSRLCFQTWACVITLRRGSVILVSTFCHLGVCDVWGIEGKKNNQSKMFCISHFSNEMIKFVFSHGSLGIQTCKTIEWRIHKDRWEKKSALEDDRKGRMDI